jgi:peroxiredoxin
MDRAVTEAEGLQPLGFLRYSHPDRIRLAPLAKTSYKTVARWEEFRPEGGTCRAGQVFREGGTNVSNHWNIAAGLCLTAWLIGCGQGTSPPSTPAETGTATGAVENDAPTELPTASIGAPVEEPVFSAAPEEGSPAWLLQEIQRIRILPLPTTPSADDDDSDPDAATPAEPKPVLTAEEVKTQLANTRAIRRERNQQVVKLATEALSRTAQDPQQEPVFLAAVSHLLDARLQLALQGDEESITALYDAAEAFHQRQADSPAAAEAQLMLVNLAHAHTLRYGKAEPRWLQEFSRQAQLYATRFPNEQQRALPLLLAAGRSCELHDLLDEARTCYGQIQAKYPDAPQAKQCEGILRRLSLVGQPLQFAGPTLDGNFLNIDDYAGKAVVIVFWATHVKPFQEQLASLNAVTQKYKNYAQVLSVSLDSEESEIDAFLEQTHLAWPVIFHVEPEQRGWNAPLAAYYGISTLPTIWIVDPTGKVAETQVTAETLQPKLHEVLLKHRNASASRTEKSATTNP